MSQNSKEGKGFRADVPGFSRRAFLTTAGTAGVVAAIDAHDLPAQRPVSGASRVDARPARGPPAGAPARGHRPGALPVTLRINGKEHRLRIDPRTTLLDCLRET